MRIALYQSVCSARGLRGACLKVVQGWALVWVAVDCHLYDPIRRYAATNRLRRGSQFVTETTGRGSSEDAPVVEQR